MDGRRQLHEPFRFFQAKSVRCLSRDQNFLGCAGGKLMVCKASEETRYSEPRLFNFEIGSKFGPGTLGNVSNFQGIEKREHPRCLKERLILTRPLREDELRLSTLEQLPRMVEGATKGPALAPGTQDLSRISGSVCSYHRVQAVSKGVE